MNHLQKTVAGYRLIRLIGMGGMADVYEGVSLDIPGKKAAVKVLLEEFRNDYEVIRRFNREPLIMQKLDSEYIIKVYGIDSINGLPVILMEYLDGMDLKSLLSKSGKIEINQVYSYFLQILEALEHAHSFGVLHRDIKPSNIFIERNRRVKVLDFGIAKAVLAGTEGTQNQQRLGTPSFMSPEQVLAVDDPDPRSDIYAMGVTLFCMLTGKQPYENLKSQYEIFKRIIHEPLPRTTGYPWMDEFIAKATSKDREQRHTDISDMRESFQKSYRKTLSGEPVQNPGHEHTKIIFKRKNKRLRGVLSVMSILLFLSITAAGVLYYEQAASERFTNNRHFDYGSGTYNGQSYFSLFKWNHIPHGEGILENSDGSSYDGHWSHGLADGRGRIVSVDGSVYEGNCKNGMADGIGEIQYENGDYYKGPFSRGLPNGFGSKTFADGSIFTGEIKNGSMNGSGIKTWPNGDTYTGQFQADQMHGVGILKTNGQKTIYEGQMQHDKQHGAGTLTVKDQYIHTGQFENGYATGEGKRVFLTYTGFCCNPNDYYIGPFLMGEMHGHGNLFIETDFDILNLNAFFQFGQLVEPVIDQYNPCDFIYGDVDAAP